MIDINAAIRIRTVASTAQRGELGKLADEYGVSVQHIYDIARGSSWREANLFAPPVTDAPWMHADPLAMVVTRPLVCRECHTPYTFSTNGNGYLVEMCRCVS